jgi:DNA-binding LytR/AlgR family response regulator
MTDSAPVGRALRLAGVGQELGLGFVYWLALVVVLEPGNVVRGAVLPLGWEAMRLVVAGALGAAVTPAVFALTRRFPIEGTAWWRRAAVHLAGDAGLAAGLVVVAGVLAALFGIDRRPLAAALLDQMTVDGLLLFFAVVALTGIAHAVLFYRRAQRALPAPEAPVTGYLMVVPVKTRGRVTLLEIARVDWVEAQGNYLALHAGSETHLIRETSARFETLLDPGRFVRIHRQSIVALDRVRTIASLPSGDATVTLGNGTELRMSRSYREAVRGKFEAQK